MKKLVSTFISVVLGLTTASSITLAQSATPAGPDQRTTPPQAGVRIFINDRLLTENALLARGIGTVEHIRKLGGSTGVAESPISNPDPNRKAADPTPFPRSSSRRQRDFGDQGFARNNQSAHTSNGI